MQNSLWNPMQIEAWERRIEGLKRLLTSKQLCSRELQLTMEGAATWCQVEESMPQSQVNTAVGQLLPLLCSLDKLRAVPEPITHLELELPVTSETLAILTVSLPTITSMKLTSLIPPPHNHVAIMAECSALTQLRKLDLCVTAWDHLAYARSFTQLTELHIRYSMWNIPELAPLTALQELTTFSLEVVDDRARFQLDFLGHLVRGCPNLRHVRADVILARSAVSDSGPGVFDFLQGCSLQTLKLDVRVPEDAVRMAHAHFRNLHMAPESCKVDLTIRADTMSREVSFESCASRLGDHMLRRRREAVPTESSIRWGYLNLEQEGRERQPGDLSLHLCGYRKALQTLPDLSAARLTRLQISNAHLGSSDFATLGGLMTLEQLFVSFSYMPDTPSEAGGASSSAAAGTSGAGAATGTGPSTSASRGAFGTGSSRESRPQSGRRHGMMTRSRKSQPLLTNQAEPPPPPDCSTKAVPHVLSPLGNLFRLRDLEVVEERSDAGLAVQGADRRSVGSSAAAGSAHGAGPSTARPSIAGAGPSSAAGRPQDSQQVHLPISRSGLNDFLTRCMALPHLSNLSLQLLADESTLPLCPCANSCFDGKPPPQDIALWLLRYGETQTCRHSRVVLGSRVMEVSFPDWFRPSGWPSPGP